MTGAEGLLPGKPRLLIVDDSESLCAMLRRGFEQRGYAVRAAHSMTCAFAILEEWPPELALLDLRLEDRGGLELIPRIKAANPRARLVVLTGYASVASAVEAIKLGATHYLVKPADIDTIEGAFRRTHGDASVAPAERQLSVDRLAWEHIQQTLSEHGGNISACARALGMHRRTLQRKLTKRPART
jgi:two-component system response regulator RegA